MLSEYNLVQNDVLDNHLQSWKNNQSQNGYGNENELKNIQNLCEDLAQTILDFKQIFDEINCKSMSTKETIGVSIFLDKVFLLSDTAHLH